MNKKTVNIVIILIPILIIWLYLWLPLTQGWGPGPNYSNVSVRTTVNVTQSYPEILNITCNDGQSITLIAGSTYLMTCLVQIQDFNGGNTINSTNITFYYYLNQSTDPDDNNVHYTNSSCTENSTNGYNATWRCALNIWYYANNGTWTAKAIVKDSYNFTATASFNVSINPLFALNVTPVIDFEQMAVGDTRDPPVQANITNLGNRQINVTVYGFGGDNETTGAGLAMKCEQRNITLPNERYGLSPVLNYDSMTPITGAPTTILGLSLPQQTDDNQQVINSTYWRLHVNVTTNPYGVCNGTVVFAAITP